MYGLDINFLNDRPEYQTGRAAGSAQRAGGGFGAAASPLPLILGAVIGLALPIAVAGVWYLQNQKANELEQQRVALDQQLKELQEKGAQIANLQAQTAAINADVDALSQVFATIRPWSALLQDITNRLPENVSTSSIVQQTVTIKTGGQETQITISGTAFSYDGVNDFLLLLQRSPFFVAERTKLESAQLKDSSVTLGNNASGNDAIKLAQEVSYRISTVLNDRPASELIPELTRLQANGLVTRIRTLEEKGVIQKQ